MTKAALNSSVIIALSATGHMDKLGNVFEEPLVARAVYGEICVQGHGLLGDAELSEAVKRGNVKTRKREDGISQLSADRQICSFSCFLVFPFSVIRVLQRRMVHNCKTRGSRNEFLSHRDSGFSLSLGDREKDQHL